MPASGTLDKDWIDQNYSYLQPRLGTFPVFEPSAAFYADLACLGDTGAGVSSAAYPLRKLFAHLGLPELAVHFEDHIPNAGEFRFSQHPDNPDIIVPVCIRIADKYRQIGDPQRRGMAIGTILAHEIAHYYLLKKEIRRETTDNERLTDLGSVVLGFGKLWFNGRNLVVEDRPEQLGYLKPLDMTYAFMEYAKRNSITQERLKSGLTPEALQAFSFWLGMVTTEVRHFRDQEMQDRKQEAVRELAAQQAALEAEVQKISRERASLQSSLAAADANQEIINRTHTFWDIPAEDHRVMEAFVTARATGAYETELVALTRPLDTFRQEVHDLGTGLQQPAAVNCDPAIFRRTLDRNRQALPALGGHMAALRQRAGAVADVHKRCFAQLDPLDREVREIQAVIGEGQKVLKNVTALHAFLTANPAAWPHDTGDTGPRALVPPFTRPEGADPFAATEKELEEAGALISLRRSQYPDRLGRFRPLREIRESLRTGRDGAVRTRQALGNVLFAQEHVLDTYLDGARHLELRLQEALASCPGLRKDIRSLKERQDRIYARHDRLSIDPEDAEEFAAITRAILSCGPEAEYSAGSRRLAEVRAALLRDFERVKNRKEPADILPLEAHAKAADEVQNDLGSLLGRVSYWMQVQQRYIDRLDARERRSVGNLLRNAGEAVLRSVQGSVTKKK